MRSWKLEHPSADDMSHSQVQDHEDLLLRARLQRLAISNERNLQGSAHLTDQLREIETKIQHVVNQALQTAAPMKVGINAKPTQEKYTDFATVSEVDEATEVAHTPPSVEPLGVMSAPQSEQSADNRWLWFVIFLMIGSGVGYHQRSRIRAEWLRWRQSHS